MFDLMLCERPSYLSFSALTDKKTTLVLFFFFLFVSFFLFFSLSLSRGNTDNGRTQRRIETAARAACRYVDFINLLFLFIHK